MNFPATRRLLADAYVSRKPRRQGGGSGRPTLSSGRRISCTIFHDRHRRRAMAAQLQRRVLAILAADVVGYSRQMEADVVGYSRQMEADVVGYSRQMEADEAGTIA